MPHFTLASTIVAARKSKGYTQEDLASITQITVRTIQRVENGETIPRVYTLKTLATALEIPFETLQAMLHEGEAAGVPKETASQDEEQHFLQMICLSCFSYLVVPIIHFLIPAYMLQRNRQQLSTPAIRAARQIIRQQVFWVAATHLSLFLTFLYNYFSFVLFQSKQFLHYLVPVAVMYLLNAFILARLLHRIRKQSIDNQ